MYIENKDDRPTIKYYACGEYGGETHRPHYHAIIFNIPPFFLEHAGVMETIWQHGGVYIDKVTNASIAYVAGYVQKKLDKEQVGTLDGDDRSPEFSLMSKKMGISYITPEKKKFYKNQLNPYLILEGGEKMAIPRYFKEKIFDEKEREILNEKAIKHLDKTAQFKDFRAENEFKKFAFYQAKRKQSQTRKTV